jgi:tol-pal system protein YbgF
MTSAPVRFFALALAACLYAAAAEAQLFGRTDDRQQSDAAELSVRLDRMENQLRQLTGTIEQLQYQNQQLQQQLSALQQQAGGSGAIPPRGPQRPLGGPAPIAPSAPMQSPVYRPPVDDPPAGGGRRGDAFDPNAQPNAPGAPRQLGTLQGSIEQPGQPPVIYGRAPGQPVDMGAPGTGGTDLPPPGGYGRGMQQAVLPPSNSPKDEYDLAYGYILRRDYGAADKAFRAFIQSHAGDPMVPQAHYWLGEAQFQGRQYNDAAETFLDVYNKYPQSPKAPEALMRLGQSLAALGKQDAACASLGAVLQKYPKASAQVKATVQAEQKRVRC